MPPRRIAILGLGLIGASLGLALRRTPSAPSVVGFDPDQATVEWALRNGAIDRSARSAMETVRDADTVVLAAPVRAIMELLGSLAPGLAEGALVTDTGSTKAQIVAAAGQLPDRVAFVGGHPLAGRLRSGVGGPDAQLFVGSVYCLTPTSDTPAWALERASALVQSVGATPHLVDAGQHDAILAAVSHLPYFAAATLVASVMSQGEWPAMSQLAAGGFRTATSLVEASDEMWTDVALTNREPLLRQLDALIETLGVLRGLVSLGDADKISDLLTRAHRLHGEWLRSREG